MSKRTSKNSKATANAALTGTKAVTVPKRLIDQIVGQEKAVNVIKKAAAQKRNVLLVGSPGTGKSLLAQAMSELLPISVLEDVLVKANAENDNNPKVVSVKAGDGKKIIQKERISLVSGGGNLNLFVMLFLFISFFFLLSFGREQLGDIITAALLVMLGLTGIVMVLGSQLGRGRFTSDTQPSKLLVDNSEKKTAPFIEATGARAGALLGDVRHDPFQCFYDAKVVTDDAGVFRSESMSSRVDSLISSNKYTVLRKSPNQYEAVFLPNRAWQVLAEKDGRIVPVDVLSVNRHDYQGDLVRLETESGNVLTVTPEHRVAVNRNGIVEYVRADSVLDTDRVWVQSDVLVDASDVVRTFDADQQEQYRLYREYQKLSTAHPEWGYERIAKALGQSTSTTRWWHAGIHVPESVQTVEWLEKKGLIPFTLRHPKLGHAAKLLGATFGDGGIFENLDGLFLSSSDQSALLDFQKDVEQLFALSPGENARIIEAGEYGHSWCYQNTNRALIRFFLALGAPRGNKARKPLFTPSWLGRSVEAEDDFYGALFGSELGVPKVHKQQNRLNTLDFAITGPEKLKQNRLVFLRQMEGYLQRKGVTCTGIHSRKTKGGTWLYRLMFSVRLKNVAAFLKNCRIHYAPKKKEKLRVSVRAFGLIKKRKYHELLKRGYGAESAVRLLNLDFATLYEFLNDESASLFPKQLVMAERVIR